VLSICLPPPFIQEPDRSQPADVAKHELTVARKPNLKNGVPTFVGTEATLVDHERAGHSRLDDESLAARETQNNMLGTSLYGLDPVSSENTKQAGLRDPPQDVRVMESGVGESSSCDERPEVANDGLDFRQLRHALPHARLCPADTVDPRT
jgi:hypothetical protein